MSKSFSQRIHWYKLRNQFKVFKSRNDEKLEYIEQKPINILDF